MSTLPLTSFGKPSREVNLLYMQLKSPNTTLGQCLRSANKLLFM